MEEKHSASIKMSPENNCLFKRALYLLIMLQLSTQFAKNNVTISLEMNYVYNILRVDNLRSSFSSEICYRFYHLVYVSRHS
jgi:hypothetical protein